MNRRAVRTLAWLLPVAVLGAVWWWIQDPADRRRGSSRPDASSLTSSSSSSASSSPDDLEQSGTAEGSSPEEAAGRVAGSLAVGVATAGGDGVAGLLRIVAMTADGGLERAEISRSVLRFLLDDLARPQPRLANARATAMALVADRSPASDVVELATRYKRAPTSEPHLRVHADLQQQLADWPPTAEEIARMERRLTTLKAQVAEFVSAPDGEAQARAMLDGLLSTGRFEDRSVALELIADWLEKSNNYQGLIYPAVDALVQHDDEFGAVLEILVLSERVQAKFGFEVAHSGAMMLGMTVMLRLRAQFKQKTDWSPEKRALRQFRWVLEGADSVQSHRSKGGAWRSGVVGRGSRRRVARSCAACC